MPGGWLVGKVGVAIIAPFFALPHYSQQYTLADMKAANPQCSFLAYVNGAVVRPNAGDIGPFETTVDRPTAEKSGWVLRDSQNQTVVYPDFPESAVADLSSPGYRDAFEALCQGIMATPSVSSHGAASAAFDGLFFDDTNMSPQHGLDGEGPIGHYSSDAAYGEAMVDFAAEMARRVRAARPAATVVCNIGADSWNEELTGRALELAGKKLEGKPLLDGFLREFTTYWTPGSGGEQPGVPEVRATMDFGARLQAQGIRLHLNDYAPPAASASTGPTAAEQADWDRRQRLNGAVALAMGPQAAVGGVVTVPFGRVAGDKVGKVQNFSDRVGSLTTSLMQRVVSADAGNAPVGAVVVTGNVLWRKLARGTVYVNLGYAAATVNGVVVPARDGMLA